MEPEQKVQKQENQKQNEEQLIEQAKKISIKEAGAYGFMDGFGIRYITPYAIALGASNAFIGFLSSAPGMIGNFSQLYSVKIMEKFSRKKIVFTGVLLQALMWLPIILLGISSLVLKFPSEISAISLIILYSLLALFGAFAGPAWSSWMKDLVTKNSGAYFGKRNRIAGFISLASMLIAGLILDYFKLINNPIIGFSILFAIAFIGRSLSAYCFTKQYEPEIKYERGYYFTFLQFLKAMPRNNFGRFTIYISLVSFATSIASPFFAVYMLKDLHFSYFFYTLVIMSNSLSSIIFMPLWGKFADTHGNLKVIKIAGVLTIFVPVLYFATALAFKPGIVVVAFLMLTEAFSGFAWAGFNLSAGNFIYDAVTRQRMVLCISYFNIINASGAFIGALIGGFLSSITFTFLGLSSILVIFLLSAFVRLIITSIFSSKIKEVRNNVKAFGIKETKERIFNLKPNKIWDFLGLK